MRLIAMSDTHGRHADLKVPDGDLLIHAGDFCTRGNVYEYWDFLGWFRRLPHKHKLVVPGNHDIYVEKHESLCKTELHPARLCSFDEVNILGLKIVCNSWTNEIYPNSPWSYTHARGAGFHIWNNQPKCDILVTHGPPLGILDSVLNYEEDEEPNVGDGHLLQYVLENSPKVHIFGHIHESAGQCEKYGVRFFNVSVCNLNYAAMNPITVIDI